MEADRREVLDQWVERWQDLVEFEVVPVITSSEAMERISPKL